MVLKLIMNFMLEFLMFFLQLEFDKLILKFIWNFKGFRIVNILEKLDLKFDNLKFIKKL